MPLALARSQFTRATLLRSGGDDGHRVVGWARDQQQAPPPWRPVSSLVWEISTNLTAAWTSSVAEEQIGHCSQAPRGCAFSPLAGRVWTKTYARPGLRRVRVGMAKPSTAGVPSRVQIEALVRADL